MKTQKRISKINDLVIFASKNFNDNIVVADIATDHGFIAEKISKNPKVEKVIATDISAKSLSKLQKMIKLKNLSKIETLVGDGLNPIQSADICVIAGIGGFEIRRMLESQNNFGSGKTKCNIFVLQPAQNHVELRNWIFDNKFFVMKDIVVEDSNRFYPIIVVDISQKQENEKSIFNLWLGRDSKENLQDLKHYLLFLKQLLHFLENFSEQRAAKDSMLFQKYELYNNIENFLLDL